MSNALTKELLKKFEFPYHTAPGEAEAECALLQRKGVVDAVLSEDVDTVMFGCTKSLRHWTAEGVRGNKEPTHVNVYDAKTLEIDTGLESEGMILVALMSGGDYIPAGVPGCGIKTACEAARAGFGMDLCKIVKDDANGLNGLDGWRVRLQRELRTNESRLFRQKHTAMTIPEDFPDMTVLGYYMHPAVSTPEKVLELCGKIQWKQAIDIHDLRAFVAEEFNWPKLGGAKKFIRGLAPALLAHQLYHRSTLPQRDSESLETKEKAEAQLVKAVCGRRAHWNTDGMTELRVAYVPADIVSLDLDAEEEDGDQEAMQDLPGNNLVASGYEEGRDHSISPTKRRGPPNYDPNEVEKIWVLETYAKLGVPVLIETWEEDIRNLKKFASRKARERKAVEEAGPKAGAMDRFVKISKPGLHKSAVSEAKVQKVDERPPPPVFLAPATAPPPMSPSRKAASENRKPVGEKVRKKAVKTAKASEPNPRGAPCSSQISSSSPTGTASNPWTLSKRPPDTFSFKSPTRYSPMGLYPPNESENREDPPRHNQMTETTHQALVSPPPSPTSRKRHSRPTTPISDTETPSLHDSTTTGPIYARPDQPVPKHHDPSKPSPRKKRSLLQITNDLYLSGQLRTPTSIRSERQPHMTTLNDEEPLTANRVNRRLDFTASTTTTTSPPTSADTSDLPSPSVLFLPTCLKKTNTVGAGPASPSKKPLTPAEEKVARRFVALRESLEGAWKHLETWEVVGAGKGVHSGVEVLDLTG